MELFAFVWDEREVAEEMACTDERHYPQHGAGDAEGKEAHVSHAPDAGNEGRKGTHSGHEAREDHRLAAMPVEASMESEIRATQCPPLVGRTRGLRSGVR